MKSILITAMMLWLSCTLFSTLCTGQELLVQRQGFDVYASDAAIANETAGVIETAVKQASAVFQDTVSERISVIIVDNRDQFKQQARGSLPDWGVGAAIPARQAIVVLSPRAVEYSQSFAEILKHEWAHIALRHKLGSAYLPRFIDEGFAMRFAGQWGTGYGLSLAKAELMGSLFPLESIDRVNFFNASQAQIAYAQSYQAVSYFMSTYGESSFRILIESLGEGLTLDRAFMAAVGADFATFEREYRLHIKQNYSWFLIFSDMTFVFIALALLIVLGFLLKKKQGKDTIKRWEEEEKYESTDFDYEEGDPWD